MKMFLPRFCTSSFLIIVICISGCGGGTSRPATIPVSGLVTFNGEPVTEATVTFYPASGRPASGTTDTEGIYHLKTYEPGDGAAPGDYTVSIVKQSSAPPSNSPDEIEAIAAVIPEKYNDATKSGLKANVPDGEDAVIDFNLVE